MITGFTAIGIKRVREVLSDIRAVLNDCGVQWFLVGGTLLGAIRNQQLIHHDKDIDIGIIGEEALYRVADALRDYYDEVHINGPMNGKILWVKRYFDNAYVLPIEIAAQYQDHSAGEIFYNRDLGVTWKWHKGHCAWPISTILPTRNGTLYGEQYPVPGQFESFLTAFYGSDWHKPKQYKDWRYNCPMLKQGWRGSKPVVMVAGATRGIGKEIASALSQDYCVSICGRSAADREESGLLARRCDLTNEKDVERWVADTKHKFGYISTLIYSAGEVIFGSTTTKDMDRLYQVSMRGYLVLLNKVLSIMKHQNDGYIIDINSTRGITAAPDKAIYSAIKHGARALTESINCDYKDQGVRATSVHLGVVYGENAKLLYGEELAEHNPIGTSDLIATIRYLLDIRTKPRQIILGGQL
jgi:NADP-dependent 3-hydroxy acid dehydrogenase YdfG